MTFSIVVDCANHANFSFNKSDGFVQQIPGLMEGAWVKLGLYSTLCSKENWREPSALNL